MRMKREVEVTGSRQVSGDACLKASIVPGR